MVVIIFGIVVGPNREEVLHEQTQIGRHSSIDVCTNVLRMFCGKFSQKAVAEDAIMLFWALKQAVKVVNHANYAALELVIFAFLPLLLYLNSECFAVGSEMVVAQLIV